MVKLFQTAYLHFHAQDPLIFSKSFILAGPFMRSFYWIYDMLYSMKTFIQGDKND